MAWTGLGSIDKTSSAEMSEAINLMFRWYQNAVVCYAFLTDVPYCEDTCETESSLANSRWFTRGWTLQELVAVIYLPVLEVLVFILTNA